ncbi:MAG: FGGY-family carbohydrate kinase [Halioglobus sp.]
MPDCILALDIGTTSVRAMVVDAFGQPLSIAARSNTLNYPAPGLIEQDPEALWINVVEAKKQALADAGRSPSDVCAIGVAAQRSSIVVWDKNTLLPLAPVISWQDLRGIAAAEALQADGHLVTHQMAASKLESVIDSIDNGRARMKAGELAWGNVDTFTIARLTGGKTHAMDLSHLSATGYFNYVDGLNEGLILAQNLDLSLFPTIGNTAQNYGNTDPDVFGAQTMIGAIVADQQSATIAQGCNKVGLGKVTYGTSGTIDVNTGADLKLATGAYPLVLRNQGSSIEFLLEGMVITAGAMFDWLAGGLELVKNPQETAAIAASVPDSGGVFVLPALQGLGTPYANPEQRAVIGGLSRAATKGHVVRAAFEGVASRVREALDQIYVDAPELARPQSLRVDGGATRNDILMQIQADVLGLPVERHAVAEATALGAAICAGETAGLWDAEMGASLRRTDKIFEPQWSDDQRETFFDNWCKATST